MTTQKSVTKSDRKKRGIIYLSVAALCLGIYAVLPSSNILVAPAAFCTLVFAIGGLYYLLTGFARKE